MHKPEDLISKEEKLEITTKQMQTLHKCKVTLEELIESKTPKTAQEKYGLCLLERELINIEAELAEKTGYVNRLTEIITAMEAQRTGILNDRKVNIKKHLTEAKKLPFDKKDKQMVAKVRDNFNKNTYGDEWHKANEYVLLINLMNKMKKPKEAQKEVKA